jgi:hypothetical protein
MANRKIVRIIHFDQNDAQARRHTRFFANVDSVTWFETDDAGNVIGDPGIMVLDWYADHELNQERAKAAARPETPEEVAAREAQDAEFAAAMEKYREGGG